MCKVDIQVNSPTLSSGSKGRPERLTVKKLERAINLGQVDLVPKKEKQVGATMVIGRIRSIAGSTNK